MKKARTIGLATPGLGGFLASACLWTLSGSVQAERPFAFQRDTFAFANETVFEYHDGRPSLRRENSSQKAKRFTQRCFVMSRSVVQFRKFGRFDPSRPPLDDRELAARIRKITRRSPWTPPFAERDRIVIPGYADLRTLSRARGDVVRRSIGLGWTSNFRPGNWRAMLPHSPTQQARTHTRLERVLGQGEFFIAFLTTLPENLHINHGVLIYARQPISAHRNHADRLHYSVYDPNHADAPRTIEWSQRDRCFLYQRDWDFVGGRVVVWQIYGRPLQ